MKAIVWTRYGDPGGLQLAEVPKPSPLDGEILVRVQAATVTAGDCELRALKFPIWLRMVLRLYMGWTKPRRKILGQEFSGRVESVGSGVGSFRPGDQVFGTTGFGFGAYAEYLCLREKSPDAVVSLKPVNMTFAEAAAVPMGGLEALRFLRKGNLQNGTTILINGAGGSIGTYAVQLAKYFGGDVTAVDRPEKLDMLRSIGAQQVIDYTREDFARAPQTYDVIFDVIGSLAPSRGLRLLNDHGIFLSANRKMGSMLRRPRGSGGAGKKVASRAPRPTTADLEFLRGLIEAGRIKSPIDRQYPLERISDAHRYVESGRTRGKVVINLDDGDGASNRS